MSEEQLKEILKDNLSLELDYSWDWGGKYLTVSINFNDEKICSEYVLIESDSD